MINWGIIGLGRIAHKFAEDLFALDNAQLLAVASRSLHHAKAFGEKYKATHCFGTYDEIFSLSELDAIYIATPHASHAQLSILCLKNGIPVLCEKPFAINLREAQQMVDASQQSDTFLMEGMWTRFLPHLLKILEIIDQDQLGTVHTVKATLGFESSPSAKARLFEPELGGGALLDIGVYPVFLAHLLLGKPDQIKADAHISNANIDEETTATLLYNNGKRAEVYAVINQNIENGAFIYGEKGHIHIPGKWNEPSSFTLHIDGQPPQQFDFQLEGYGFYLEAIEVMECVRRGMKESNALPLAYSLDVMETLDRIRREIGLTYPADTAATESKRLQM